MKDVIAKHRMRQRDRHCTCGLWRPHFPQSEYGTESDQHVEHIAQELTAAGYGKTPEPIDPDKATIINGWLVVEYGSCTCGGGDSASGYHHEGGCGYEPLMNITEILASTGYTIEASAAFLAKAIADPEGQRLATAAANLATTWGKEWAVRTTLDMHVPYDTEEDARAIAAQHGSTVVSRVVAPWKEDRP